MPIISYIISSSKNEGLITSPSFIVEDYLKGVPLVGKDGSTISNETIKNKIKLAQKYIENIFSIKIQKQRVEETKDFNRNEFKSWAFVKTTYPVSEPFEMKGVLNAIPQIIYPKGWLSVKRYNGNSEDELPYRAIYIVPNSSGGATIGPAAAFFSGITPNLGFLGGSYIPNYWNLVYITGFDKLPEDLVDLVSKLAVIPILEMAGDMILGAGVSSTSLGLDGLSQSISTTKSGNGGAYAGRIKSIKEDVEKLTTTLKYTYRGIPFDVV